MKNIFENLINTQSNNASPVLRVMLGSVLFAHGARNMLGWFGGNGYTSTMQYFTDVEGLPYLVALAVISLQFFGAILILVGLATRLISLGVLGMFLGMITTVHYRFGFFMNWLGSNSGEGFEYHLLVIGICAALIVLGGGSWSADRKLTQINA